MKMNKIAAALSLGAVVLSANVFAADATQSSHTDMLVYAEIKDDGFITDESGNTLDRIVIELIGSDFNQPMKGTPIQARGDRTPKAIYLTTNAELDTEFNLEFVSKDAHTDFKAVKTDDNNAAIPFTMTLNGELLSQPGETVIVATDTAVANGLSRKELKLLATSEDSYGTYGKGLYESLYDVYVSPKG